MKYTISMMADIVELWFYEESPANQFEFIKCTEEDLIIYHNKLGRDIRNHFKLWEQKWVPELRDGIDFSKEHPDYISMEVIKEVWRRVK